jgi:hypothetical protein
MGSRCFKLVLLFAIGLLCARGEHWLASHASCLLEEASSVSEAYEVTKSQLLQPSDFSGLINPTQLQNKSYCGTVFDLPASPSLARVSEAHIVRGPPSC